MTEKSPRRITPLRRYGAPAAMSTRSASTRRQPDPRYMKLGAPVLGMGTTRLSLIRTIAQWCRAGTSAYMIPKPTVYLSLGTGLRYRTSFGGRSSTWRRPSGSEVGGVIRCRKRNPGKLLALQERRANTLQAEAEKLLANILQAEAEKLLERRANISQASQNPASLSPTALPRRGGLIYTSCRRAYEYTRMRERKGLYLPS